MKKLRGQLSYANVISTLCLFLLLGGGAYAAAQLPRNSVGTRQIKDGAVTPKKLSKASLAALGTGIPGTPGAPGRDGQPGPPGTAVRWALVNGNGDITASSDGATKVTIPSQNSSQYFIDFHTPVTNRPILVSTSYQENPGFADTLQASPCGGVGASPGATNCPALPEGDNNHTVFVLSTANGMLNNPQGFYVVLLP